jgi:sec-independent protein translocase protein TatB
VFGFSFGELVVLVIVAVVVIGPKDMPKVLRKMGQWAGKLRRMASDIRQQSGIDDVLRGEGIAQDIAEIRKLARGEMDNVTRAAKIGAVSALADPYTTSVGNHQDEIIVQREREYPREGADSYGALLDTALVYANANALPASPLARDPLYRTGDPDGVIPQDEPAHAAVEAHETPPSETEHPPHDA